MPETTLHTAAELVELARRQLGKPYIYGIEVRLDDPDPRAFDCSELIQWLYAQVGCSITDGAWLQYAATVPIRPDDARPGDLVFLRNNPARPDDIGHVGMVAGYGAHAAIVEARGRLWGVTDKRTLATWRDRSDFAGVRRYYPRLSLLWETQPAPSRPVLRLGSRGESVKTLQSRLGVRPTGWFGPVTRRKVRAYQRAHGLVADGVVGPLTWAALGQSAA
jgi:hypothetical protein